MDPKLMETGAGIFLFGGSGLALVAYLGKRMIEDLKSQISDLNQKLDKLIEGRVDLMTRLEHNSSLARVYDKVDRLEAHNAELRNRLARLETICFPRSKEGK